MRLCVVPSESSGNSVVVRRGVWAAGWLMLGLVIGRTWVGPWWVWLGLSFVVSIGAMALRRTRGCMIALGLSAVLLGAGWFTVRVWHRPPDALDVLLDRAADTQTDPTPTLLIVDGEIEGVVRPFVAARGAGVVFDLRLRHARIGEARRDARGTLRVIAFGVGADRVAWRAGDTVEVTGRWTPAGGGAWVNPGERDGSLWCRQDDRVGSMRVESGEAVALVSRGEGVQAWAARSLASARTTASRVLDVALAPEESEAGEVLVDSAHAQRSRAFLRGMLLGIEEPTLRPVSDALSKLGMVHILSISGFHLVLASMVVVFLVRLTGDRGAWEPLIAAGAVVAYVLIVPPQAPVLRSALMILALLASEGAGRRYDRLNILGWVACGVLLWRPMDLWSVGFQLSFGVTAALIWRGRDWHQAVMGWRVFGPPGVKGAVRPPPARVVGAVKRPVAAMVSTAGLAWVVSAPVVAWSVGLVSLLGTVAGMILTIPATGALIAGFLALLLGLGGLDTAAGWLGSIAVGLSGVVVAWSEWIGGSAVVATRLPPLSVAWCVSATLAAIALIAPGGWKRWGVRAALIGILAWAALSGVTARHVGTTLDAGVWSSSEATLVRDGGVAVLVDPGSAFTGDARGMYQWARACGAWRVEALLITAPQRERLNHAAELIEPLGVRRVYVAARVFDVATSRPDSPAGRLFAALQSRGVPVEVLADELRVGATRVGIDPATGRWRVASASGEAALFAVSARWASRRTIGGASAWFDPRTESWVGVQP